MELIKIILYQSPFRASEELMLNPKVISCLNSSVLLLG